jgi:hypothetical protein
MLTTALSSPTGDGVAKSYDEDVKSYWRRCYRVMMAMMLPGRLRHGVATVLATTLPGSLGCDAM